MQLCVSTVARTPSRTHRAPRSRDVRTPMSQAWTGETDHRPIR
ncbi:hypothetical protein A7982_12528 [Minicystis rosea]|nr:hypothetical protein A7982_12528 [Minicystis rosea]